MLAITLKEYLGRVSYEFRKWICKSVDLGYKRKRWGIIRCATLLKVSTIEAIHSVHLKLLIETIVNDLVFFFSTL